MVFDGTSRLGEVLAIVIRFVDDWEVQRRLVRLEFLQKSVSGEELARELISVLSVALGVESNQLLAVMHNRVSVNAAAVCIVKVVYPNMVDIGCISHTLDIVGDKFKTPDLNHFFTLWNSLFLTVSKQELYGNSKQAEQCHRVQQLGGGVDGK